MIVSILNDKIAYYHAPKCGSRTVLAWNAIINNPSVYKDEPEWFSISRRKEYGEIRSLSKLFPGTIQDWKHREVPVVDCEFKFCILRDPIERFVSGFTNRILFHKACNGKYSCIEQFINDFDSIISINRGIENHFRSQVSFYGQNPNIFDKIYTLDKMGELKTDLEDFSGMKLPDLRLQQSRGVEKPILTPFQNEWIKNRYSDDYRYYWNEHGK